MSAEVPPAGVPYIPPPQSEQPKHFATMLIGIVLIFIGAVLINQGMNTVQTSGALIVGVGLLAAGALLVFAGASQVLHKRPLANICLIFIGISLLVASGTQLASNLGLAVYGVILTLVGIILIVVGVQAARHSWKKFMTR